MRGRGDLRATHFNMSVHRRRLLVKIGSRSTGSGRSRVHGVTGRRLRRNDARSHERKFKRDGYLEPIRNMTLPVRPGRPGGVQRPGEIENLAGNISVGPAKMVSVE